MINLALNEIQAQESPFNSIRHYDDKGLEFWKARELMKLLGYKTWQKFEDAIDRAVLSCENSGGLKASHFGFLPASVKSLGRSGDDWKLSKNACRLIAMNGDPRKVEIASAQAYFSSKVEEAEAIIPVQNDRIRELELMVQLAEAESDRAKAEQRLIDTRDAILKFQPPAIAAMTLGLSQIPSEIKTRTVVVDQMGNVVNAGDTLTKTQIAHELGFVNGKGKAETKQVANLVDEAIRDGAIPMPWRDERTVIATGFDAELLPKLKAYYQASPIQRQRWMGEN
jgi:hypothetical protein